MSSADDAVPEPDTFTPDDSLRAIRLLRDLFDRAERSFERIAGDHYLVIVPEHGAAWCERCASFDALVVKLKEVRKPDLQIFIFHGERLGVSRGGDYLIHSGGREPLYTSRDVAEEDDAGWMGPAPAEPAAGDPAPEPSAPPVLSAPSEEAPDAAPPV